ncbi:MAG: protein kinase, partial [Leptolyngbya sp.]|nr:protein kinase [Candidatus Melainabacteria bacterium]
EAEAISLGMQMCSILEYLHGHAPQVVHRDFTPDNLLLDENGVLKLIDFNLAKVSAGNALPVGKPAYMAPEQVKGRPEAASDFYSLGALMYFLVTGVDPEPLNVSCPLTANRNISVQFNDLIMRLTDQSRETRVGSASEARKLFAMIGFKASA